MLSVAFCTCIFCNICREKWKRGLEKIQWTGTG